MLESADQTKKIDLIYHVINHQWFRVANIILCSLQNTNLEILPTKTLPNNFITDYKEKKDSKHFDEYLLGILGEFP